MKKSFAIIIALVAIGMFSVLGVVVWNVSSLSSTLEKESETTSRFYRLGVEMDHSLLSVLANVDKLFQAKSQALQERLETSISQDIQTLKDVANEMNKPEYVDLLNSPILLEETSENVDTNLENTPKNLGEVLTKITDGLETTTQGYQSVSTLAKRQLQIQQELKSYKKDLSKILRKGMSLRDADAKGFNDLSRGVITVLYTSSGRDVKFAGSAKFEKGYKKLNKQDLPPSDKKKLENIRAAFDPTYERVRELLSTGSDVDFFHKTAKDVIDNVQLLQSQVNILFENGQIHLAEQSSNTVYYSIIVGLLILSATIAIIVFAASRVISRVNKVVTRMEDIAEGEGDLTVKLEEEGNDELTKLAYEFNVFVGKIRTTIQTTNFAMDSVVSSVEQTTVISNSTSDAVIQQQTQTDSVAHAIAELNTTISNMAANTENASVAADECNEAAIRGQDIVSRSKHSTDDLATRVLNTAETMSLLHEDVLGISSVLDVIHDISEQTNLLALNAAIEAARAGEQGRGFAVVADEVRQLAGRTQESTKEISAIIESLQNKAKDAVSSMQQSSEEAKINVDNALETQAALSSIVDAVATISSLNTEIASATEEQNATVFNINTNLEHITHLSNETSKGAQESLTANNELSNQITDLRSVLMQFRV